MRKGRGIYFLLFFIVILIIGVFIGFFLAKQNKLKILYLEYGDNISQIPVYNIENKESEIKTDAEYTLLFYFSAYCGSCMDALSDISLLYNVFTDENISVCIIWLEEIPLSQLNKYNIPIDMSYTLNEKIKLDISTPTCYLLDQNGVVMFRDVNAANLIDKAAEQGIFAKQTIKKRMNDYLRKQYKPELFTEQ